MYNFDKISTEFCGIFCVFVNIAGFHRCTCISRLRDCAKYQKPCILQELPVKSHQPPSPLKMNVRVLTKIFNQFIKMMPYSRPKFSGFYTLSQTKLLQNHTLDSSTYLELIYNSTPPTFFPIPGQAVTLLPIILVSLMLIYQFIEDVLKECKMLFKEVGAYRPSIFHGGIPYQESAKLK